MYTSDELDVMPQKIEDIFSSLENEIMADIINRISETSEITRTADYEIYRLYQIGKDKDGIKTQVQKALSMSNREIDKLYSDTLKEGYVRDKSLYDATGKKFVSYEENEPLQQLIKAVKEQTNSDCENITNTLGFAVRQPNGRIQNQSLDDYFRKVMDEAVMHTLNGTYDYNTAISKAINEMTNSGVRSIDYKTGRSTRIDVAARRAVLTGMNQVTSKISEDNMKKLDTEFVETSWHGTARPSHQEWQGRVFYWDKSNPNAEKEIDGVLYKSFINETGYGTVTGLCGANCRHTFYAFIPGISVRKYTDAQLDEMHAKENQKKEYNGKEYTTYEATQYQRRLETLLRKQRQDIKLLKDAGFADNSDEVIAARCRYRKTSDKYREFSRTMGLPEDWKRVTVDGLRDIGHNKYTLKNADGKPIMEVKKTLLKSEPNSITQLVSKKGGIDRNYYDESGRQYKQITNNNHGNAKMHPYGKNGEHAHDYIYDEKGNLIDRPIRELSIEERKENGDIL